MEVDEPPKNVLVASGASGSMSVFLHPLVIMNISDHWTRTKAQEGCYQQVVGALIGKQTGRQLEVMNSFELLFDIIEDAIVIDRDYYDMKEQQFKQVFSDLDFIGWYATGDSVTEMDIQVHKQLCEINESPVFLKLNPKGRHTDLPVTMYESVIDVVDGEATVLFVELAYTLATEEAERIGLDHMARTSISGSGESSLAADHLQAQHSALKMLQSRVRLMLDYVKAVKDKKLEVRHDILRDIYSLCYRLPIHTSEAFKKEFFQECNDVALMTYLGVITKGCNTFNQLIQKRLILKSWN